MIKATTKQVGPASYLIKISGSIHRVGLICETLAYHAGLDFPDWQTVCHITPDTSIRRRDRKDVTSAQAKEVRAVILTALEGIK